MQYTVEEEKSVVKKLDRHVVLLVSCFYLLSFLDRSNIGNARIAGLTEDLNLSSSQYEWLLTAFYITYVLMEWMSLLYRVVPAHIYIALCVGTWGIVASAQALAGSFAVMVILRACLGISEAAFGPGCPFYLSFFYRREELGARVGIFIACAPLATSFASSLAWVITKSAQGGSIAPWRLLFLIEGFPSVIAAAFAWHLIPDGPNTAKFLSKRGRKIAELRLNSGEPSHKASNSYEAHGLDFKEIWSTLLDPKCYLTGLMFFSCNVAFASLPPFLPTVINEMNYSPMTSQILSAPPYLVAFAAVLITSSLSDRLRARGIFIMLHGFVGAFGYALIAVAGVLRVAAVWRYVGVFFAASGFFSAVTLVITWTINNQRSESRKGTAVAMMNIFGQLGPLLGTRLYPDSDRPYFIPGMTICAGFMLFVGFLASLLRIVLARANERRKGVVAYQMLEQSEDGVETDSPAQIQAEGQGNRIEKAFEFML